VSLGRVVSRLLARLTQSGRLSRARLHEPSKLAQHRTTVDGSICRRGTGNNWWGLFLALSHHDCEVMRWGESGGLADDMGRVGAGRVCMQALDVRRLYRDGPLPRHAVRARCPAGLVHVEEFELCGGSGRLAQATRAAGRRKQDETSLKLSER
jgi:hypothetical protein